ncbi:hypothetical protein ACSSS7_006028 [Eimeria intestinalis]
MRAPLKLHALDQAFLSAVQRLGRLKSEYEANEKVRKHVAGLLQQLQDERYLRAKLEAQLGALEYAAEQRALEVEAAKQHRQSANEERLREHRQFAEQLAVERQQTETLRQEASNAQQEAARFQLRNERQLSVETEERRSHSMATLAREKKEQQERYEQIHQSLQHRLAAVTAELNELKIRADQEPGRLRRLLEEKRQETERSSLALRHQVPESVKRLSRRCEGYVFRNTSYPYECWAICHNSPARATEDLDGQTAECERLREDLSALEQRHRQVLQQLQQERESLAKHMQQQSSLQQVKTQDRARAARIVAGNLHREWLQVRCKTRSRLREKLKLYKHLFRSLRLKAVQLQHEREALTLHLKTLREDGAKAICELLFNPQLPPALSNAMEQQSTNEPRSATEPEYTRQADAGFSSNRGSRRSVAFHQRPALPNLVPNLASNAAAHGCSSHTVQSPAETQETKSLAPQGGQPSIWLRDVQTPDLAGLVTGSPQRSQLGFHQAFETQRNAHAWGRVPHGRKALAASLCPGDLCRAVPIELSHLKHAVPTEACAQSHAKATDRCPLHGISSVSFTASPTPKGSLL